MDVIDTQENDDGTVTTTYSDGTWVQTDPTSDTVIDQGKSTTQFNPDGSESVDVNGFTYRKNADGTYSKIDEAGVAQPSTATEFSTASQGRDPAASTADLNPANISTNPTTSKSTSTVTGSDNLLTQMQNVLKGGGLGTAGGVAAITALSKALGGGLVNPGGTTGVYRGYQGGIPQLTANRTMNQIPANYRPGGGGLSYFSPLTFTDPSGKIVTGVGGSGSPMNVGDATGNVTGPTMAGALTPTNTNIPGGITNVGDTSGLAKQLADQRAAIDAANQAAAAAAAKAAADKAAADKLAADKLAADKLAADKLAAETARQGTQTALGNIVAKYPNAKTDPHQATQMQVELANYMDTHGVKAADLPNILKGASYGKDWTPDIINSTYKAIDPLAQVVAAYQDKTKTPAEIAALAAKNGITTQQLQNYGVDTAGLNSLASQGYLSTPLLTSTLQQDYNAGTPAGIASINNILAKNPSLTPAKIQEMFPGIDLNAITSQGINIPGYTPTSTAGVNNTVNQPAYNNFLGVVGHLGDTQSAAPTNVDTSTVGAPSYTNYSNQNMADYIAQHGIDVSDAGQVASAVQATNADPGAVNSFIASNYPTSTSDNSGAKAGGLMRSHYAMGGFAPGGISGLGSYSDGGRMLKGPGDGVSDSIPAVIGGHQKAALADGEFVIPARIVSEIGNGSSDAGARKLYAMMDRIQNARKKTTKNVAANTRAEKYLPA